MKEQKTTSRVVYFDVLNILSILAVVGLHHNGIVHSFRDTRAWRLSLVVECGCYWAVPVFLMISGATLLGYRERYDTRTFLWKRVQRTVIPWLFWSVVMLIWKGATGQLDLSGASLKDMAELILNYKVESVYWFFGALFACYLAVPVFSLATGKRSVLWYAVGLNFLFASVLPVLKTWFGFSWSLDVPVVGSLLIYLLLGYLLSTMQLKRWQRLSLYAAGICCGLFRYCYTYALSIRNGVTDTSIKGYVIFHAVFLSAAVFVLGKAIPWERCLPEKLLSVLEPVAACSFGVFLIHKMVMYYEQQLLGLSTSSHIWRIGMVPVTYLVSLGLVMLIRKLPWIGKKIC